MSLPLLKPCVLGAGFDVSWIVFLFIILASAAANWLQQHRQQQEEKSDSGQTVWRKPPTRSSRSGGAPPLVRRPGTPTQTAPSPRTTDWEAELRRLLGDPTVAPEQPSPPPVQPPPLPPTRSAAPRRRAVPPRRSPPPSPPNPSAPRPATLLTGDNSGRVLAELEQAPEMPSALEEKEALARKELEQLKAETAKVRLPGTQIQRRAPSPDAVAAIRLVRNPATVRQAVIASLILGPPKSAQF